jgi:hypothetical protein
MQCVRNAGDLHTTYKSDGPVRFDDQDLQRKLLANGAYALLLQALGAALGREVRGHLSYGTDGITVVVDRNDGSAAVQLVGQ